MSDIVNEVKIYLDITWDDADSDNKLSAIIGRGMNYIDRISGLKNDYSDNKAKAFELLLEYVRYVRSGKLNEFQKNYLHELLGLQIDERVKDSGDTDV